MSIVMKAVFRDRFAELVRTFVHSKRERDEYELNDRAARRRERGFQRRLASLERGQEEFDSFIESASLEIEHLHAQLSALLVERGVVGGVYHGENSVPVVCEIGGEDKERSLGDKDANSLGDVCLNQRAKRRMDEWVEI